MDEMTTEEKKQTKVLGYVRVSSTSQEDNTSLPQQRQSITDYCKSRGWTLDTIYEDVSSGGDIDRDGYKVMEEKLDDNGFDGVVVYKMDRLSRSIVDGSVFVKRLFEKGKFLLSIQEGIDTQTPNGRLFYNLLLVFSENERQVIKDRMKGGKTQRVKEGKLPSGYIFGYERDDDGHLIVKEDERKVIEDLFDFYLEGESLGYVMKKMEESGYKTRKNKMFSRQTILNLLRHPIFCGKGFRWGDELVGDVPRIVTTNKWNKTQRVLDSKSKGTKVSQVYPNPKGDE